MRSAHGFKLNLTLLGTLLPIIVNATPSFADETAKPDYLGLNLALTGQSFQTPQERSVFFGPVIDVFHRHAFNPYIETRIDLAAELFTGSATGILPPDILGQNGPRNDFRLREGLVDVHSLDHALVFQVGAISGKALENPLLVGDYAFLGAKQELMINAAPSTTTLTLEEAIPPSSFSLLETAAQERTPTFYTAKLAERLGEIKDSFFKVSGGYFQFDNLTTAQARQSLFLGNTVTGNASSAAFYLPYRGVEGGLQGGWRISGGWQTVISTNAILNEAAPKGSNAGYLAKLQLNHAVHSGTIATEFGYYYDQSDSSPALFTDLSVAAQDHRGYFAGLSYKNEPNHYSIFARVMHGDVLVPALYVGNETMVSVGLEMHYDIFN